MDETNNWFDSSEELPPCDGMYEVTNFSGSLRDWGIFEYNGYGFIYEGSFRPIKFWRYIKKREKKYGKVEKSNE